jgi:MerR family transcriptional regulator/heat shock protein HspR
MNETLLRLETVAEHLAIDPKVLLRYEQLGFIHLVHEADVVGLQPKEIRRIWTIVSFQRDLGVNLAGVEVILRLKERIDLLQRQVVGVARDLEDALETEDGTYGDAP